MSVSVGAGVGEGVIACVVERMGVDVGEDEGIGVGEGEEVGMKE